MAHIGNVIRQGARSSKAESSWMAVAHRASHVHKHEYVPLSRPHKFALTLGSLFASLINPARGDMIALLSELSGEPLLPKLREMMLSSPEGRSLMMQRPAINTQSVEMKYLEQLPENTFGKQYWNWLKWCNVGPDTRAKVRFIQDSELAYVMQRYRECHDFYHLMCSMPVNHLGETVVKIFEAAHMGLPVAFLSSIAGPLRLSNEERSSLMGTDGLAAWAWKMGKKSKPLIGVRWEEHWETDMDQLRASLGFDEPPPIQNHTCFHH
ncbi:coenzyme Q biosynthesis Coq4 [Meira miltonrushii]|uniref:4-hydroxy-3-methoxy-5-polyprenylbenzoate decarboxylase n=1 Tax=Meira miltonrushii TaxID=1280837 RepID=A0A316VI32_9BASI|nr:coenzyme Q biosynthesis Coq4 [Meira miltonrushii]PWN37299.1 coenzyme Q biosynthesis Coq4 [Meira miltonrushii]